VVESIPRASGGEGCAGARALLAAAPRPDSAVPFPARDHGTCDHPPGGGQPGQPRHLRHHPPPLRLHGGGSGDGRGGGAHGPRDPPLADPDGRGDARDGRLGGHLHPQGGPGDGRDPRDRADRARHGRRPQAGRRGGVRRIPEQARGAAARGAGGGAAAGAGDCL
ncbi:MAG: hypothetical protein AVDCRST_MAG68-988, partial [uncultured Gemmatimonadetes bacterium]